MSAAALAGCSSTVDALPLAALPARRHAAMAYRGLCDAPVVPQAISISAWLSVDH
jgi:hypothetical protein